MLDLQRLGVTISRLGAIVLLIAVAWWFFYFESLSPGSGPQPFTLGDILPCLYKDDPICDSVTALHMAGRFIREFAEPGSSRGGTAIPAYEPAVFWVGLIALVGGILLRAAVKR